MPVPTVNSASRPSNGVGSRILDRAESTSSTEVQPGPAFACPLDLLADPPPPIPRLLMAHLSVGPRIGGPPAIDREFKTIDFLTVLDIERLPPHIFERHLRP